MALFVAAAILQATGPSLAQGNAVNPLEMANRLVGNSVQCTDANADLRAYFTNDRIYISYMDRRYDGIGNVESFTILDNGAIRRTVIESPVAEGRGMVLTSIITYVNGEEFGLTTSTSYDTWNSVCRLFNGNVFSLRSR